MKTDTSRRLRWLAPFVAGAAIAAAAILPGVAAGSDHPTLPARTAAQLLADLATARPPALSGTVVETARLGLPELPSTGSSAAELSLTNLVTGSHTVRVWLDGPSRQRVALVGDLAESDVVHNGRTLWVYSSSGDTATRVTLPADAGRSMPEPMASAAPTPAQIASQLLAKVDPTTRVSVDATARVAGRAAYQIVLSPKDSSSLVSSVTIALDAQTSVPLRVQVYGRDHGTPAFETAFTDITYAAPPASVFTFVPPTGARVQQTTPAELARDMAGGGLDQHLRRFGGPITTNPDGVATAGQGGSVGTGSRVIGSGWTAVVETSSAALTGGTGGSMGQLQSLLLRSATAVPDGRLITTALLTALITDDGHLYVGAVDGAALQRVAATGRPA